MVARLAVEVLTYRLEPASRVGDLGRGPGRPGEKDQRFEVLGISRENPLAGGPSVVRLAAHEVHGRELETHVSVVGFKLLSLQQEPERLIELTELVVGKTQLPNGLGATVVYAKGISILNGRLPVLLLLEV